MDRPEKSPLRLIRTLCFSRGKIAANGQEAMEKFESVQLGEYDLILMDVHIAKPVQSDNLKNTIQQVMEKRLEQAELGQV